ncbi:MAG: gamma-glutamyltransferase [Anditalea sp.]
MKSDFTISLATIVVIIGFLGSSCKGIHPAANFGKTAIGREAMVVTAHPEATKIGLEIMAKGGNAVDAMVGVHFALAVVYPSAGNIGGGGFMVLRDTLGEAFSLDFREKAPLAAHEDMYLDEEGEVIDGLSLYGQKASGIPGSVDGMLKAHEKFGSLPLKELIDPAIRLAKRGFKISEQQARNYNLTRQDFINYNRDSLNIPLVKKELWEKDDRLQQHDLAQTLERIKNSGRAGFYEGETARLMVEEMKAGNGIITEEDLLQYQSVWRDPVIGDYKGVKVISMGPPSSGGIALLQLLTMASSFNLNGYGHNTAQTVHLMTEMERRVYADRASHLGDSDYWEVPQELLLDESYLNERVAEISLDSATSSEEVQAMSLPEIQESEQTTHYSIIDADGTAVSVTTTINSAYGSKVFVTGAGFLLNNEMDDFSSKPGVPNTYGLLGGAANAIAPEKRMLSAMTPTILEKDGKLLMVLGTPGGSTIITSVFQTILNVLAHDMSITGAVAAKRVHHQWKPDLIQMESDALDPITREKLEAKGHQLDQRNSIGRVDAILVKPDGSYEGAGDPRGDDWAGGY